MAFFSLIIVNCLTHLVILFTECLKDADTRNIFSISLSNVNLEMPNAVVLPRSCYSMFEGYTFPPIDTSAISCPSYRFYLRSSRLFYSTNIPAIFFQTVDVFSRQQLKQ